MSCAAQAPGLPKHDEYTEMLKKKRSKTPGLNGTSTEIFHSLNSSPLKGSDLQSYPFNNHQITTIGEISKENTQAHKTVHQ